MNTQSPATTATVRKKPGPKPRGKRQEKFSTTLPSEYRDRLESYSDRHQISMAEALRRAIDSLEK